MILQGGGGGGGLETVPPLDPPMSCTVLVKKHWGFVIVRSNRTVIQQSKHFELKEDTETDFKNIFYLKL